MKVLILNVGSSSVKFQLIETSLADIADNTERRLCAGLVDKIGIPGASLRLEVPGHAPVTRVLPMWDHASAIRHALEALADPTLNVVENLDAIEAVGHRVVHGGEKFSRTVMITPEVIGEIEECYELAPLHNPHNVRGIELAQTLLPTIPHFAFFDTSFHQTMPPSAFLYGLNYQHYQQHRVRRYGFHGASHRYMTYEVERRFARKSRKEFRLVTVHLGNGCSVAAVDRGRSVDTSMGFTPLEGLVMGSRCGDLDASVVPFLMAKEELSLSDMSAELNRHSGLKGLSGVSSDMRAVLAEAATGNARAQVAVEVFCHRVRRYLGAFHFVLGGADYIAVAGGIGENSAAVRMQIFSGMEGVGIQFDDERNHAIAPQQGGEITTDASPIRVFVVPTNEELVIARDTVRSIAKQMTGDLARAATGSRE